MLGPSPPLTLSQQESASPCPKWTSSRPQFPCRLSPSFSATLLTLAVLGYICVNEGWPGPSPPMDNQEQHYWLQLQLLQSQGLHQWFDLFFAESLPKLLGQKRLQSSIECKDIQFQRHFSCGRRGGHCNWDNEFRPSRLWSRSNNWV